MNKKSEQNHPATPSNFLLYTAADGNVKVEVYIKEETVWLTQKAMAELFGVKIPAISKHLANIFETSELQKEATLSILETVQSEGKRQVSRKMEFYNLDAIIAVGYRVNSYQATQFRIWATKTLKEFIIKGFVLDDERLKQGKTVFGRDYFEELLERIREIPLPSSSMNIPQKKIKKALFCNNRYSRNRMMPVKPNQAFPLVH